MRIRHIFSTWIFWRVALFLISALSIFLIPVFGNRFPYNDVILKASGLPPWLYQFGNFDGVHYARIAKDGYAYQFTQAFFPLYPLLIKIVTPIFLGNYVLTGIVISSIFAFLSIWMFIKLLELEKNKNIFWIILFFLFFPMAFYLGTIYNESLFLFLVFSCFYFAKRKKWWLVGIFGGLASATRLIGVFLLPALIYELYYSVDKTHSLNTKYKILNTIYILLVPFGLFAYMTYLQFNFHDALYFLHAQGAFGASRSTGIVFPLITLWRYFKILTTVPVAQYNFWVAVWEAGFFLAGLLLLSIATIKRFKISYLIFSWCAFLLPLFTGTLSSFPRYLLVCFPIYILLGSWENKIGKNILLITFLILNSIFLMLFARGYWVS